MNLQKEKRKIRERRKIRARAKIFGTGDRPRLSVFRSNKFSYVQLIDDEKNQTVASASTKELTDKKTKKTKTEEAKLLGRLIAERALEKKIKKAVFDRGRYKYHGRIKSLAEGAKESGLTI